MEGEREGGWTSLGGVDQGRVPLDILQVHINVLVQTQLLHGILQSPDATVDQQRLKGKDPTWVMVVVMI